MIGKIAGRLDYCGFDHAMIDVGGVGYIIFCSERTLTALPPIGEAVALYTDMLVREDAIQLYGFLSVAEKEWHCLLMTVQGIGAKASLSILGTLGVEGLAQAIALGDWSALKAAKGVGPKTAQKAVIELKDKAPQMMTAVDMPAPTPAAYAAGESPTQDGAQSAANAPPVRAAPEALSALSNLGYAPAEAARAVAQANKEAPSAPTSDLIRAALKILAPKG